MIFFGCPIDIRHLSRIAADQIRRMSHTFYPKPAGKIHFVYFSCARDIDLLTLSLTSLVTLRSHTIGTIYVVADSKGPFSQQQENDLRKILPGLEFLHLGKIDWASVETLKTELSAFAIAASNASAVDFIAKLDSDVLFFDKTKLQEVSICAADFVGDGHYSNYKYAQGGLYFLRAPLAASMVKTVTEDELTRTIEQCGTNAEDQVISALAKRRTCRIWLTRLMLFPNEYEKVDFRKRCVRNEFSSIHFVHQKTDMPVYAKRLGIT